ncbi:MAG TPA: signal peptide peptidase SppA [Verrucomicrobiae bacterium]|nr:signal peptide peptidase SppA [Verrucomicrobiae bacterium]
MDTASPTTFNDSPPPPPLTPPPVMAPGPPARPPRRGRGWMIFAFVLLVLLGLSVLMNLGHLLESMFSIKGVGAHVAGPRLDEVVLEDNDASSKIAVVPVEGIITSQVIDRGGFNLVDIIKAQLKRADKDDKVKAVILKVDSPGGEVLASDEISRALEEFQDKSGKPVIVSMGSLAASGGYYISAPSRWIVANELTITGSIGVIMHGFNYRGLMNKVGVRPEVYKSGKFKDMLSGSREPEEVTPEERQMLQALIDETYNKFKDVVAEGRKQAHEKNEMAGKELARDWMDYADGRVLSGKEAQQLGFVDEVGNFDVAAQRAKKIAKIRGGANLIEYRQRYDLSDFLGMFGESQSRVLKVDVGIELPKLEAGRLYFLSPTYLH